MVNCDKEYLIVVGDSNSYGSESIVDGDMDSRENINNCYGFFLAEKLGIKKENYHNLSLPGASNLYISKKVTESLAYFEEKNIDFSKLLVIVGWSEPTRTTITFPGEKTAQVSLFLYNLFYKVTLTELLTKKSKTPKSVEFEYDKEIYKKYLSKCKEYPYYESLIKGLGLYFLNSDLALYQDLILRRGVVGILENKGINYFSFPTIREIYFKNYFDIINTFSIKNNIFTFKKNKYFFNSKSHALNFCFFEKFSKFGRSSVAGHLKREAHNEVAEFIFNELRARKII